MTYDYDPQVTVAQRMRRDGWTLQEIADHSDIDHGVAWVRKVTRETETDE